MNKLNVGGALFRFNRPADSEKSFEDCLPLVLGHLLIPERIEQNLS